ncbi:Ankyrin-2 [Gryllus bimaculatus]|nr:Ankyrin-2 [Gryllus bimaculatus]
MSETEEESFTELPRGGGNGGNGGGGGGGGGGRGGARGNRAGGGGGGGGGGGCDFCCDGDLYRASSCQGFSSFEPCAPFNACPAARGVCPRRRRSSCAPSPCCSPSPPCAAMPRCYSPPLACCPGGRQLMLGKRLLRAAACGQTKCVRRLLCEGAEVNFVGVGGTTPLHRASAESHPCVVTLLLNSGANPNERTCSGLTALHLAAGNDFCGRCVFLRSRASPPAVCTYAMLKSTTWPSLMYDCPICEGTVKHTSSSKHFFRKSINS